MECAICKTEFVARGRAMYCSDECRRVARDTAEGRRKVEARQNRKNLEKFRRFLAKRGDSGTI
ncbi:MAG: hypothetical protein ACYSW8_31230 [Planctomycetota bacterium]|jgi:hypothetical protein